MDGGCLKIEDGGFIKGVEDVWLGGGGRTKTPVAFNRLKLLKNLLKETLSPYFFSCEAVALHSII